MPDNFLLLSTIIKKEVEYHRISLKTINKKAEERLGIDTNKIDLEYKSTLVPLISLCSTCQREKSRP
jgi:hypothetical protein